MKQLLSKISRTPEVVRCLRTAERPLSVIKSYLFRNDAEFPKVVRFGASRELKVLDWDELTTVWHVCFGGEYSIPRDAKTILDLGANIGAFAVWVCDQAPSAKIVSVEPFPSTYLRLVEHIELNRLESRVTCLQAAVSSVDGVVKFDATEGKRSYCRTILTDDSAAVSIEVPSLRLQKLLDQCAFDTVDCLKMDVEGAEYDILLSADQQTLSRIRCLTMEYHDSEKAKTLWRHLTDCGFRRTHFVDGGWSGLATYVR